MVNFGINFDMHMEPLMSLALEDVELIVDPGLKSLHSDFEFDSLSFFLLNVFESLPLKLIIELPI